MKNPQKKKVVTSSIRVVGRAGMEPDPCLGGLWDDSTFLLVMLLFQMICSICHFKVKLTGKKEKILLDLVAHICNFSYVEGRDRMTAS
jgi:hypothetical protein